VARLSDRLPENVGGEFFVDSTCIDCDTCRQIAPEVFAESKRAGMSYVHAQPQTADSTRRALMALVACPTASIGTERKHDVRGAAAAFPERVEGSVFYCGFCSEASFGASSYLVVRQGGNVLVDSPRFSRQLLTRIEALGGARWMFLSHQDDVADHRQWAKALGCERVLHEADQGSRTSDVERVIEGEAKVALAEDLTVVPVPGHTRGSLALLHGDFCFSGDHLWGRSDGNGLSASRSVCWYSWPEQTKSVEKLEGYAFRWVLPGHGRRFRTESPAAMQAALHELTARMRGRG
jgi:glyoxylase-like metal-dependent hydrolase (beta-lactamase superfamily II)/ferredoxin